MVPAKASGNHTSRQRGWNQYPGRCTVVKSKVLGVRAVIGKGGLPAAPFLGRAVYLAYPGGCGAAAARQLRVLGVHLKELGMAESLWQFEALDMGPMIVAVDARIRVDYPKPSTDPYHHLAIHPYPAHLSTQIQLNDGTDIVIRPIRPEDAEMEAEFVRNLSNEAKYFRFMNALQELSQEMLVRLTQIDYYNEMALIAVRPHAAGPDDVSEEQIGVVRYTTNLDQKSCEFALVVADAWQQRGIGSRLMQALMEAARTRGFHSMEGEVLGSNQPMLALVRDLGFTVRTSPDDPAVKRVSRAL